MTEMPDVQVGDVVRMVPLEYHDRWAVPFRKVHGCGPWIVYRITGFGELGSGHSPQALICTMDGEVIGSYGTGDPFPDAMPFTCIVRDDFLTKVYQAKCKSTA